MKHLFAIFLVLALFVPSARPACKVVSGSGKRFCVCWSNNRWEPAPMLACRVWR